ncbi:NADH dehydrogenase [ubiquinone] 1 alpha subcomplex subunit 3 isoform X1 [Sciurus carolinensis]|uniref:NADH dehydrogenase [ubiquinone] 1 alpha subcomplex subunit 3 isoform X1 n=1 Tax=Sciurus carolinensis TaxID=30640 RepID=UPI001FB3B4CB|nr:NADH dehydrogenase [ubiquinone] 1 alpha subcomplex subunit 3 isoform X1 [Sciurus carolinensis]
MAAKLAAFLKNAWAKEPVLVVSFTIGSLAVILPPLSPYTKYAIMINKATPYNYPVLFPSLNSPQQPALLCRALEICRSQWPTLMSHSTPPR